jgi:hypothetical protein
MAQLLFYRDNDGLAAVGHIASGKFVQTDSRNDFTHNWFPIVGVEDQLLFYRFDGLAAVGHISEGKFVQTDSRNDFAHDWTLIVGVGDQLLCYRRGDGLTTAGRIANGKFVETDSGNFQPRLVPDRRGWRPASVLSL